MARIKVSLALALISTCFVKSSETPGARNASLNSAPPTTATTCEARTINYITHGLPQLCLTSAWTSATTTPDAIETPAVNPSANTTRHDAPLSTPLSEPESRTAAPEPETVLPADDDEGADSAPTPFMSAPRAADDRIPPDMGHAGLGEEDEISLNFDHYLDNLDERKGPASADNPPKTDRVPVVDVDPAVVYEADGMPPIDRSKDAGKTCKERFSYSSFDAGATVLKTSPGAKNAKAILVENKDSYMLLECSAKSKFVIVELSDDVLIDTLVLANFEFFSSMVRAFRVAVSDRYPVKTERWRELGVFEARNSRDIQPFLVENPQMWAKYVRIEFLTHYGKEYYCPVSLLRVHGSRMLDSWKDTENGREEEGQDGPVEIEAEAVQEDNQTVDVQVEEIPEVAQLPQVAQVPPPVVNASRCELPSTADLFRWPVVTCDASPDQTDQTTKTGSDAADGSQPNSQNNSSIEKVDSNGDSASVNAKADSSTTEEPSSSSPASPSVATSTTSSTSRLDVADSTTPTTSSTTVSQPNSSITSSSIATKKPPTPNSKPSTLINKPSTPVNKPPSQASPTGTATGKNRTTGTTSSSAASPTVQEGFFKAISKRLQQVESNLTLSLKYVEDQARHVQDAVQRTEQKQLTKVTLFLETLNATVLAELRTVRGQYDEIWQSTVIALESQREQSEREIVALSTRLNLLADEVVFQKRMAIVQAVLLLSCLLLVIFSRGVQIPYLGPIADQANGTLFGTATPSSVAARRLYSAAFDANSCSLSVLDLQQGGVDYIPITTESSRAHLEDELSYQDALSADIQDASESHHLSPPLTPELQREPSTGQASLVSHEPRPNSLRSAASMPLSAARKPLPALPENPSSP
ncbi:hypothetical protein G7046_g2246 [Stylonectria norvegica]|nr:hypothetical protein G7046_g2246 [Stylonectria norvegica]